MDQGEPDAKSNQRRGVTAQGGKRGGAVKKEKESNECGEDGSPIRRRAKGKGVKKCEDSEDDVDETKDPEGIIGSVMAATPGKSNVVPLGEEKIKVLKPEKAEDTEVFQLATILEEKCVQEVHLEGRELKAGEKSAYATVRIPVEFLWYVN